MRTVAQQFKDAYMDNNVIRWNSNDTVPPKDILQSFVEAGLISMAVLNNSLDFKKVEDDAFLEQYIANRRKYGYSDEERFEMQAAFGGETVIDVFTGEVVEYA
jgi:hypothetical protein